LYGSAINANNNGTYNTALGYNSLRLNSTGYSNLALGVNTLQTNSTGYDNAAISRGAMNNNTTGYNNVALGRDALYYNTTGNNNVAIGFGSMNVNGTGLTNNTAIGATSNVFSTATNATAIGFGASSLSSNNMVFGNASVTSWLFGSTTAVASKALIVGSTTSNGNGAYLTTGGTWTNASGRDFKDNFEEIDGNDLLDRVDRLPILKWNYKGTNETHIGPIAEEFKELFNLGIKDDNQHISTIDGSGVALKAAQVLSTKMKEKDGQINELKTKNAELEESNKSILERVKAMELMMQKLMESKK
jgi:Chaperone of endosialidase